MKTRIVHTKMWRDTWFRSLSPQAQDLFIYCITNPNVNLSGVYELTDEEILFDRKHLTNLTDLKKELTPKILFYNEWVYVKKASELSGYSGMKNDKARLNELKTVPLEVKQHFGIDTPSIPYPYPSDTPINHKSKIINHKSETISNPTTFVSLSEVYKSKLAKGNI